MGTPVTWPWSSKGKTLAAASGSPPSGLRGVSADFGEMGRSPRPPGVLHDRHLSADGDSRSRQSSRESTVGRREPVWDSRSSGCGRHSGCGWRLSCATNARMPMAQTVIVTGASSGIGRATTEKFAASGAAVLAVGRNELALEEVVKSARTPAGARSRWVGGHHRARRTRADRLGLPRGVRHIDDARQRRRHHRHRDRRDDDRRAVGRDAWTSTSTRRSG